MKKKPIILGIETSCDETAASIIQENEEGNVKILSNIISSQVDVHKEFGGVVPELAARSHAEKIDLISKKAISESGINIKNIDAVAATAGPGLIVCLSVGLNFGKAIASFLNKPFIAVNHLEGHALSPKLVSKLNYPYLLLLISGGHSQYLSVQGLGKYKRLGTTIDDALGEAFDKTAKLIGIEFPDELTRFVPLSGLVMCPITEKLVLFFPILTFFKIHPFSIIAPSKIVIFPEREMFSPN